MTWIRLDCGAPRHPTIGFLAEALGVDRERAFAKYVRVLLEFGDHRPDGMATLVTNSDLEEWAGWTGKAGRFAVAFRDLCVERRGPVGRDPASGDLLFEDGQRDPPGRVKGWWRNLKILEKQIRDRQKPDGRLRGSGGDLEGSPESSANIPRESREGSSGDVERRTRTVTDTDSTTSQGDGEAAADPDDRDPIRYVIRAVGAANRGLDVNPAFAQAKANPLIASNEDIQHDWIRAGIPIAIAEVAIAERARAYRPTRSRRQPYTLRYFDKAVRDAWDREVSRRAAAGLVVPAVPNGATEKISDRERLSRKFREEEART